MRSTFFISATAILLLAGCIQTEHKVETHHKIDPIHITVDVNLKVERELTDFFGDLDEESALIEYEEPSSSASGQ